MSSTSPLHALISQGTFVVTAEVTPPLSASAETLLKRAAPLKGKADAVNVTDAAGARAAMSSFAAAAILKANGIEPILQVTCRDRNRIAMVGDLIGAAAQGISNVLFLYGDSPEKGDMPDAKPVHDVDSRGAMMLTRQMRDQGTSPSGREIESAPRYFVGGADTPFDPPADWEPKGLIGKADAGADFIQTQFIFDLDLARRYFTRLRDAGVTERLSFIVGVGPIVSAKSARWMDENLHGVSVPEAVIARLEGAEDERAEGRKLCVELIQGMQEIPGIAGVHIMAPMQKMDAIGQVIEDSRVLAKR